MPEPALLLIDDIQRALGLRTRAAAYKYLQRHHVPNRSLDRRFRCYAADLVKRADTRPTSIEEWRERGASLVAGGQR